MKIGVAGAGLIVPFFLEAAALVEEMEVSGLFARRQEARRELCEKYRIPVGYGDYREMLEDRGMDVVYIALPNTLHFSFAKEALEAGKHVILEKPFTVTLDEAKGLAKLAGEKNLYLFEAITNQYNPNYEKMKELIPGVGDVKIVQFNFSQYSSRYDAFKKGVIAPVFDPAKAGGAFLDLNIYNIHMAVGLFGKPLDVHYYPNMERGVDTSGILMMEYPGFQCVCIGAKDCGAPCGFSIQGDKGCMASNSMPNELSEFSFWKNKGEPEHYRLAGCPQRLYYELASFAKYYEDRDEAAFAGRLEHSLSVMEIVERVRSREK